jgi:hypothetical protein
MVPAKHQNTKYTIVYIVCVQYLHIGIWIYMIYQKNYETIGYMMLYTYLQGYKELVIF